MTKKQTQQKEFQMSLIAIVAIVAIVGGTVFVVGRGSVAVNADNVAGLAGKAEIVDGLTNRAGLATASPKVFTEYRYQSFDEDNNLLTFVNVQQNEPITVSVDRRGLGSITIDNTDYLVRVYVASSKIKNPEQQYPTIAVDKDADGKLDEKIEPEGIFSLLP